MVQGVSELAQQRLLGEQELRARERGHLRGVGELVRGRGRYLGHLMRVKGGNDRSAQVSVDGAVTGRFSKNRIKRRARRVRTSARRVVT
jgi:hypothetical protein